MTITWKHKPLAGSKPRPWEDRRFAECSFPLDGASGETLSCCLPVVGEKSYCSGHMAVVYVGLPLSRLR